MSYNDSSSSKLATAYAVYVEKELVGKRIKKSKVKVVWQFAFDNEFQVHLVELKHSFLTGKIEVKLNDQPIRHPQKKDGRGLMKGQHQTRFKLQSHNFIVTLEDTNNGCLYDFIIDGQPFHRLQRKSLSELETLKKAFHTKLQSIADEEVEATTMGYNDFVQKDSKTIDGGKAKKDKKKKKKKDKNRETVDNGFSNTNDTTWDAFGDEPAANTNTASNNAPAFDPFGEQANTNDLTSSLADLNFSSVPTTADNNTNNGFDAFNNSNNSNPMQVFVSNDFMSASQANFQPEQQQQPEIATASTAASTAASSSPFDSLVNLDNLNAAPPVDQKKTIAAVPRPTSNNVPIGSRLQINQRTSFNTSSFPQQQQPMMQPNMMMNNGVLQPAMAMQQPQMQPQMQQQSMNPFNNMYQQPPPQQQQQQQPAFGMPQMGATPPMGGVPMFQMGSAVRQQQVYNPNAGGSNDPFMSM